MYSKDFLESLGDSLKNVYGEFDIEKFMTDCLVENWDDLKLMERSNQITISLHNQLPDNFEESAVIIEKIAPQFTGLVAICLPNYVAKYGLNDWQVSMNLLEILTKYSSGEFAIRPFLIKYPEKTEAQMLDWSKSKDIDVRRLSSEGIRPRLPWGIRLKQYVEDPTVIWPILENLIYDDSEYVQKSVANNLNDISKDHPDLVIQFSKRHWGHQESSDWVINRGLRTLFKQGNPDVLSLLGYEIAAAQSIDYVQLTSNLKEVKIGGTSTLNYRIYSNEQKSKPVYLGYRVHYVRKNNSDSYKDFFIKKTNLLKRDISGSINIKWKQLSTRKLYTGEHLIELLVNTIPIANVKIDLTNMLDK
jgi:3-methyladenine DNA glycosylase AlkC